MARLQLIDRLLQGFDITIRHIRFEPGAVHDMHRAQGSLRQLGRGRRHIRSNNKRVDRLLPGEFLRGGHRRVHVRGIARRAAPQ